MQADTLRAAREDARQFISKLFPNATTEVKTAAGGWVIAVIGGSYGDRSQESIKRLLDKVEQANKARQPGDRIVIFSCHFFPKAADVFSERATLRVKKDAWENGALISRATASDAYVRANVVDAEAILLDFDANKTCRLLPDPDFPESERFLGVVKYVQFDLGGSSFRVESVDVPEITGEPWCVRLSQNVASQPFI